MSNPETDWPAVLDGAHAQRLLGRNDVCSPRVVADDAQIVEVYAKKKFSVAPKMIATIFPLDATPSNRRASR